MIKFQVLLLFVLIIQTCTLDTFGQIRFIKGEHLCKANNAQEKSLLDAVIKGDESLVEKLLEKGGNPNITDDCGIPLIIYAAKTMRPNLLKILIKAKVDVNTVDTFYNKPLLFWLIDSYEAQINGKSEDKIYESIRFLIDNGANVNFRGKSSESALIKAVLKENVRLVELLIASGAEINYRNDEDRTAYSYAAQSGNKNLKGILIKAGADVNIGVQEYRNRYGENAFFQAAADGRTDVVEAMLACGTDVNMANEAGKMTALMRATEDSTIDVLLTAGADLNLQDKTGHTALIWAVLFRRTSIVEKLIAAGADVNLRNFESKSALDLVQDTKTEEILIKAGAK